MNNKKQIKTGLWNKISNNGTAYADGRITIDNKDYKVLLFLNKNKLKEKSPDFQLILEEKEIKEENKRKATDEEEYAQFGEITEISDDDVCF